MSETRLNIGAGDTVIDGFTPIDRQIGKEAYPLTDYADASVEEIRASHILEHFSFADVPKVLGEWVRVLKPGGRIRIAVPNLDWLAEHGDDPMAPYYMMGGQEDNNDFHKAVFTAKSLQGCMAAAGVTEINRWESTNTDCASLPCSLNLEGVKSESSKTLDVQIAAVCSIPRLGWNDNWGQIFDALNPFRIPLKRYTGAFWGQCLQRVMEEAVAEGTDWILTIDYDSMFTSKHLDTMFGIFGNNPHIDALASLQSKRRSGTPLFTVKGKTGIETDGSPIQADTAHFGCTLIRTDALKDVPKPWFHSKPDAEGGWGDGRIDEDIWFWHQWKKAGKTLFVAPDVRIGHLEVYVQDYDDNMEPRVRTTDEWRKEHRPQCVSNS